MEEGVGGSSIFGGRLRDRRAAASLIRAARETPSVSTVYTYPCQLSPAGGGIKAAASPVDGATQTTKSARRLGVGPGRAEPCCAQSHLNL